MFMDQDVFADVNSTRAIQLTNQIDFITDVLFQVGFLAMITDDV